jgi:hypothetical protein
MFITEELVEVRLQELREEARRCVVTKRAARKGDGDARGSRWQWRVEPSMEGVFGSLLGWLLSSQRGAKVEVARSQEEPPGSSLNTKPGKTSPRIPLSASLSAGPTAKRLR